MPIFKFEHDKFRKEMGKGNGKRNKYELVEDQETLQNLQFMLVRHASANFVVQFRVREGLNCLKTLV